MSVADTISIVPEGGCFRTNVICKGSTCSKSYSTLRAAANDAVTRGLILPATANELIMRGIRESFGWRYVVVGVDFSDLAAHDFICF